MAHTHPNPVLILGASSYIGRHLTAWLSRQGQPVIAASSHPERLSALALPGVRNEYLDLMKPHTLPEGLWQAETLYYLFHNMEDGPDFVDRERQSAQNLRHMLRTSHVRQIICLGTVSSSPPLLSEYAHARQQTGDILRNCGIPVTEIRIGPIIGPGSVAFEVMRSAVEHLPILMPPHWTRAKSSPIALDNLLHYLDEIRRHPTAEHRVLEAAGPDFVSYISLLRRFIRLAGKRRWVIPLPLSFNALSRCFLQAVTSLPRPFIHALIASQQQDIVMTDNSLQQLIPQRLQTVDDAIAAALNSAIDEMSHPDWGFDATARARWRPGFAFYPKRVGFSQKTVASSKAIWHVTQRVGGADGYFYANRLWRIRARIDDLCGNQVVYGRPARNELRTGDNINGWRALAVQPPHSLNLLFGMKAPGLGRLTFTIDERGTYRIVGIHAWWHPDGWKGLLYWYLMTPIHVFIFRGMTQRIAQLAEEAELPDPDNSLPGDS
ncbi:DUF2867 domain-containing protein [Musicola paradisiaca]|uniref:NAD-dependent epimerase/dehydratase n=1 Tax=Musicola paradisiaca (strain Ech703) TaxID=579405 RepID=C6C7W6_MUSP7|nr:DUF2867 domain-containing protein [Musicola paradisiaca]ACS86058.1 NAD-dependent epimerase/dehydratase [Musicola paradisiaca Ech703]